MEDLSIREIFPRRLTYYMAQNGKTRSDLVRDLGFKYSTVRDWEKSITVPRMDKVEMLANYFNCSTSDLLEEKEKPTVKDDGLSENQRRLIEFAKSVPEDKADLAVRLLQSLLEAD